MVFIFLVLVAAFDFANYFSFSNFEVAQVKLIDFDRWLKCICFFVIVICLSLSPLEAIIMTNLRALDSIFYSANMG